MGRDGKFESRERERDCSALVRCEEERGGGEEGGREEVGVRGTARQTERGEGRKKKKIQLGHSQAGKYSREWRTVCSDKERLEENRNQMREADEGCSITTGEEKVFCGECREEANAGKELWTM